jgi:signal transduction histidine kinase
VSQDAVPITRGPSPEAEPLTDGRPAPEDRYAELAELAGSFIHEIKNHLGTLKLNLELLAEDFQEAQTPREKRALTRVQRLQNECERLESVSKEFLAFARIRNLEREPADLSDVVDELIEFYQPTAEKAGINIIRLLPADLPPVRLNREMFKQALLNLLLNAQQAMPSGGDLTIQASVETSLAPRHESDAELARDMVCLSIIDTGVGMTPEVLANVFRAFYSTRPEGTGLGLPTTRRIIEAHDGTMEVQSEPGRGTRFVIRLPLADNGPRAAD